jgi:hypothetical protein
VAKEIARTDAGAFAKNRFKARRRAWRRRIWWALPLVAAFEITVTVGIGYAVGADSLSFYWGFGLGVAFALVVWAWDSPPHHVERWRRGAEGEKATARVLRRLQKRGWFVMHDIDIGRGNIDHVAVGPPRIFLLESKKLHGKLAVDRGVLRVVWHEDPTDGYDNHRLCTRMQDLARMLERRLRARDLDDVVVQPVVVLWGDFEQRSRLSRGVAWVRGRDLGAIVERTLGES